MVESQQSHNFRISICHEQIISILIRTDNTDNIGMRAHITNRTVIEVATHLVDSVTDLLLSQIGYGNIDIDDEETPLELYHPKITTIGQQEAGLKSNRSRVKIQMETVDIDQHKKMIRKFMSLNKKLRKKREMRSVVMSQRSLKLRQNQDQERENSRNKMLQQRRKQIEKRMQEKRNLMKQIQKSTLQSNSTVASIRKKKFLYQQKQQEYYDKVLLPKIQEENKILQQKRALRKPIDIAELQEHEKHYEQMRINSRVNRSLTISVIKSNQTQYRPPQFVSEAYKKAREEEQRVKLQQEIKRQEVEINEIRKKQFLKKVNELREKEQELAKSKQKLQSPEKEEAKPKMKPQMNREQQKNTGNEYLRELLANNRKYATAKRLKPMFSSMTEMVKIQPKVIKSEYQIEIIKEERIERVHKIRSRKIHQLMNDKHLDEHTRHEKLKFEIEKLDQEVEHKMKQQGKTIESLNESAMVMMNAIQAKMALLGVQLDSINKASAE